MGRRFPAKPPNVSFKRVAPARARDYLNKAGQHLELAKQALTRERWDSAFLLSIHAGINAVDSACVHQAGMRSTGESHSEAVRLLTQLFPRDEAARKAGAQLAALVDKKSTVEYDARRCRPDEAVTAVDRADRLLRWAQEALRS